MAAEIIVSMTKFAIKRCITTLTEQLPESMMTYCQFDLYEQTSVNFQSKHKTFLLWKAFDNVVL